MNARYVGRWLTPKYSGEANTGPATYHKQARRYKNNDAARGKRGRPLEEEVKLYNLAK